MTPYNPIPNHYKNEINTYIGHIRIAPVGKIQDSMIERLNSFLVDLELNKNYNMTEHFNTLEEIKKQDDDPDTIDKVVG